MEWSTHPAAQRPTRLLAVVTYIVGVATLVHLVWSIGWVTLLAVVALLGSAGEFLFPATYRLTAEGAERRSLAGPRRLQWSQVKAVYTTDEQVSLRPTLGRGLLDSYRGLDLPFAGQRDIILDWVDRLATARLTRSGDDEEGGQSES